VCVLCHSVTVFLYARMYMHLYACMQALHCSCSFCSHMDPPRQRRSQGPGKPHKLLSNLMIMEREVFHAFSFDTNMRRHNPSTKQVQFIKPQIWLPQCPDGITPGMGHSRGTAPPPAWTTSQDTHVNVSTHLCIAQSSCSMWANMCAWMYECMCSCMHACTGMHSVVPAATHVVRKP
jgi:hypothetical protein